MKYNELPIDYKLYTDKYFLRTKEILQKDHLNPMVKVRLFVRKECRIEGLAEAIEIIREYSDIDKTGHIFSLKDGDLVQPLETIMVIEAPVQSIVDLETMYLGIISGETSLKNLKQDIDLNAIETKARDLVNLAQRPIAYFGARHWRYDRDLEISAATLRGGFTACSTDIGASNIHKFGIGTIPHALEAIYHWVEDSAENAVLEATLAFDQHIDPAVPRIALVDYNNREIDDSLKVCQQLPNLYGVRVDTCGENIMQGGSTEHGVSVEGVVALKNALIHNGYEKCKVILTSGFGNVVKLQRFLDKEKELGIRLFDELGIGEMFPCITATADIVEVDGKEIHKVGRTYTPNPRLQKVI